MVGLRLAVGGEQLSHTAAPGTILSQDPPAGGDVAPGTEVRALVAKAPPGRSLPPAQPKPAPTAPAAKPATAARPAARPAASASSPLPNVRRLPLPRARALLQRGGWTVTVEFMRYDEDVSPMRVMSQSPAAGTPTPRGAVVRLVVNPQGD